MKDIVITVETEYLFLQRLQECDKAFERLGALKDLSKIPQEALLELQHYINVIDAWLNPENAATLVWNDIPLEESKTYVKSLCEKGLNNPKVTQKIKDLLPSLKAKMNRLAGERRGGRYERA